jgi:hypothetical protein
VLQPRLSLARCGRLPGPRCLPSGRPAGLVLARPRLLSRRLRACRVGAGHLLARCLRPRLIGAPRVRACHAALSGAGRHGSRRANRSCRPCVCPLRCRRVSRWLPDGHGSRPRLRLGCLPGMAKRLAGVSLPGVPRVRWLGLGPRGAPRVTARRRSRHPRVVGASRARPARRGGALRARGRRPGAGCLPGPWPAHAWYRVVGPLPRAAVRSGIVPGLPCRARRVPGSRHAAFLARSGRSWRQVRGPRPRASHVILVARVDGVGTWFQVRVALVGVAIGIGSAAGTALRASARPAALTIHPQPPGDGVRGSPPL